MPKTRSASGGATVEARRPAKRLKAQTASKSKKIRTAPMGSRVAKGALKGFLDLPLDIMYEVFSLLHPLDLLHIAWASKSIRKIVMSRSSVSCWRRALATIEDLPECPTGMNEPQYARIMFDETCHTCGAGNAKRVILLARLRCCDVCLRQKFKLIAGAPADIARPIFAITPYTQVNWATGYESRGSRYYYVEEMYRLQEEYCDMRNPTLRSAWMSAKEKNFRALEKVAPVSSYTMFLNKVLARR